MTPQTQCVLYARKSTEDDDKQVMSIEAQLVELREYAEREHIEIVKEFTEAKSAKKPGREALAQLFAMIETSQKPLGILAWHPDRLARNSVDGGKIIYLVDTGKIAALRFPQFWFEPTPQGKFMLQVAFGQSKYFSDSLVENVKRGIRQKIRRGEWLTLAPLGYVNNSKTRNIEPHPVYSKVINLAFEEYSKGSHTLVSLAAFLADHGILQKKGTPLAKVLVVKMLTNRAYLGFIKHRGEWHQGSFAPILSSSLFEAAQKVLKSKQRPRKHKENYDFPFTRFASCGECGNMITAQYAVNRWGTRYTYYRCTKKGVRCSQSYIQAPALATQLETALKSISVPPEEIEVMERKLKEWEQESISSRVDGAQHLKANIKVSQEKLNRLVSLYLDGDIEREIYLEKKDLLLRQKAKIEERMKDSGKPGQSWLEPSRKFVSSLKDGGKLANEKSYTLWRNFFRSIGSNPILKDKLLSLNWSEPWTLTAKTLAEINLGGPIDSSRKSANVGKVSSGAQERTRTSKPLRALPPQGSACTNFATWALLFM